MDRIIEVWCAGWVIPGEGIQSPFKLGEAWASNLQDAVKLLYLCAADEDKEYYNVDECTYYFSRLYEFKEIDSE